MKLRLPSPVSEIVAVISAVAAGAVLITTCLVLVESGIRSSAPAERLTGADIVVGGEQSVRQDEDFDVALPEHVGLDSDLISQISAIAGVTHVGGDLSFPAAISDGAGGYLEAENVSRNGHGWSALLDTTDLSGQPPTRHDDVVLTQEAAQEAGSGIGETVEVALGGEVTSLTVSGVVQLPGKGVFVSDERAATASGRPAGTVDLITVRLAADADPGEVSGEIESLPATAELVVHTGQGIGQAEHPQAGAARGLLLAIGGSLGGTVMLLVGFLTAGTVSITVTNRARELALLRAVGATPRQIRTLVARQTLRISLVALVPGVAAGYLLARSMQAPLTAAGLLISGQELAWSPLPGLAACALLIAVGQVASRGASLRISRQPATESVTETGAEPASGGRLRTRIGLVVLTLSLGSAIVPLIMRSEAALISATSGTLLSVIGLSLVAPAAVRRLTSTFGNRTRSPSRWLAVHHTGAYALRTGGAISVLALAVGLILTQIYAGSTLATVTEAQARAGTVAQVSVSAPAAGGISPDLVQTLAADPAVRTAVPITHTSAVRPYTDGDRARAEELTMLAAGAGAQSVLDLDVAEGDLGDLTGESVALDTGTAWRAGVGVGERIELILADGTSVEPLVVATYRRGFGFGNVVASMDLLSGARVHDLVLVTGDGSTPGALEALTADLAGVQFGDPDTSTTSGAGMDLNRWLNLVATTVLMGYVLLGVANRLVATTLRRRREWAMLRSIGMTAAQLRAMARAETGLVCLGAAVAGLALSLVPMTMVALGLLGRPWPQGPAWTIVLVVGIASTVAYLATMVPARQLLRGDVASAVSG